MSFRKVVVNFIKTIYHTDKDTQWHCHLSVKTVWLVVNLHYERECDVNSERERERTSSVGRMLLSGYSSWGWQKPQDTTVYHANRLVVTAKWESAGDGDRYFSSPVYFIQVDFDLNRRQLNRQKTTGHFLQHQHYTTSLDTTVFTHFFCVSPIHQTIWLV